LSYKLLRFVNSASFARAKPIGSLKHAMIYMGEGELKKFIALLALANLNEDGPSELLHMSIVRARFCDQLAALMGESDNPPAAFLTGLFSLVDALLEQPLEQLLDDLPILPEIKAALLSYQGQLGLYLQLTKAFENGEWDSQQQLTNKLGAQLHDLYLIYLDAVTWAHGLMQTAAVD
jgi:EAL and modified HD-GYP domain-containing signal transduction protein